MYQQQRQPLQVGRGCFVLWGSKNLSFILLKIVRDVKEWPQKALAFAGPGYWGFPDLQLGTGTIVETVMKQFHTTAYALQCQSCHPLPTRVGKVHHAVGRKLDFR